MTGLQLDQTLQLVFGLLVLVFVFVALRSSPRLGLIAFLISVCFVPVWIGVRVSVFLSVNIILSLLVAASLVPVRIRWSRADLLLGLTFGFLAFEAFTGATTLAGAFESLAVWFSAYVLGRSIAQVVDPVLIYRIVAVTFTVVAVLALVEFVTSVNPFIAFLPANNFSFDTWGTLQPRGSVVRAEGAFGQAIALGASLGMAAALTMGTNFGPRLKAIMIMLMAAASVVTFSRTGIITTLLAIVLGALFLRDNISASFRRNIVALVVIGAAVAVPFVSDVFQNSDEAEGSALYRSDLLELVRYMRPLGLSTRYVVSTTREVSIGSFASIDNSALLFGLTYGWLPLVLLGLALLGGLITLLRRQATPAVLAIVCQVPAFLTVALITQYASMTWFIAGLAVSTQVAARLRSAGARGLPDHAVSPLVPLTPKGLVS